MILLPLQLVQKSDRQISTVRSLSSSSASLWFVEKSDRLQNLYCAIAQFYKITNLTYFGK
ncbi:hypothetical protein [Nostoc sp. 'Peltigera membranacea cyanobiont' N6]|uniref:hypothetical protein n=1 Tax=Nostoc sp. 'Peltigera membranacea cyanobiont' N6 TaxID=1261031 RepID=UPI0011B0DAE0|nr:hypothetical protein [Nostoc sp. 'Peltigera membranacea cyanobiont' N6]